MGSAAKSIPMAGSGAIIMECQGGEPPSPFRAAFEKAAVGLAQIDVLGRFQHVNQAFCDLVGYSLDELTARTFNWRQLGMPEDLEADRATLYRLTCGEIEGIAQPRRYVRKDGRVAWVDLSARLLLEKAGTPRGLVLTAVDTTEWKQSEETMRQHAFYDELTQLPNRDAVIDAERQNLFKQGNQLLDTAMRADVDPAAFKAALKRLLGLIADHFHNEEGILEQRGYARLAEHAAKHAKLLEHARVLGQHSDERGISVGELVDFLVVEVVTKHILQEDRDYFQLFGAASDLSSADCTQPEGGC